MSRTRRVVRRAACWVCCLLAAALAEAPVRAQQSSDRQQASVHFDRGLELIEEEAYAEAAVEFERAFTLSGDDAVLYNLGMAYAAAGHSVEATEALSRYLERKRGFLPQAEAERIDAELRRQRSRIGFVSVEVEPAGAVIAVDSRELGTSPLSGPVPLTLGEHRIEVSLPGYASTSRIVSVAGEQHVQLRIRLPGEESERAVQLPIRCTVPDVTVLVDERVAAQPASSAPILTSAGAHVIRFRRLGYVDTVVRLVLAPGMAEPIDCALCIRHPLLDAHAARLDVRVSAKLATTRLDGEPLPRDRRVPIGRHHLQVTSPGFEPWPADVTLGVGEQKTIEVELVPASDVEAKRGQGATTRRTIAYVVGGSGIAAGVAALAVYLIGNARFGDWEKEKAALDTLSERAAREPVNPKTEQEIMTRSDANNERLKSVWQFDTVSAALAIGGGALLATGTVLFLTAGSSDPSRGVSARLALRGPEALLVGSF